MTTQLVSLPPRLQVVADAVHAHLPAVNRLSDAIGRFAEPGLAEYRSADGARVDDG